MEQNFNLIYQTSFENDSFSELQKYCTDLISKEPDKIFNLLNFSSISDKLLISIIQNDDFQRSEIQVWEHVLKWGHAQHPELPSNVINFSKDDFNILKSDLQKFIPFIQFYNLTSKEFMDKVFPYREILPEELYVNLLKTFLSLSDRNIKKANPRRTIDSRIITPQYAELISKWIDRLEITDELISSYEFKLLFRGSRDGFTRKKFHEICDNKPRTVTIVKVKNSNEVLGGYNPLEWNSYGRYSTTKDSFIFSFNNDDYILSRVVYESNAIFNDSDYGPLFGYNDLIIWGYDGNCSTSKSLYEKPIRKIKNFSVEECEIFQIV
ncbi:hypothetical protein C1646_431413 [Rhizophagus diaphanus]|nr:hypothetical protein C1646_431413 [Rhizophagus diaphanus] [Rhizophagus sp. MUCL 43196]